jgi:hypothetical protein
MMMILAIAVSTMITVAIVVFAIQYYALRKEQAKRDKVFTSKGLVGGTQEVPIAS